MTQIILKNLLDTQKLAELLSNLIEDRLILTINGELAAGKTTFTKFFAKSIGITETVTSPTFNILKAYEVDDINFYHIDAYRLEHSEEDLGFEDIFYENNLCIIEWGTFIADFLPQERLNFDIRIIGEERIVEITSNGIYYNEIERLLKERWQD